MMEISEIHDGCYWNSYKPSNSPGDLFSDSLTAISLQEELPGHYEAYAHRRYTDGLSCRLELALLAMHGNRAVAIVALFTQHL